MDTGTYRAFGLTISSDIPLPELEPIPAGAADCAFRMAVAAAPRDRSEPEWVHLSLRADGSVWMAIAHRGAAHVIRFPGMAEFSISPDGSEIQARRGRGVPLATVRHLLLDHVLPRVLDLKGALVLHAGAVANAAGAILLLGRSGKGKSTLTASLARAGYRVLGDDVIVLREAAGRWYAVPSYPGLRLWSDSAATLLGPQGDLGRVSHYSEKTRGDALRMGAKAARGPMPILRAYVLDPAPAEASCAIATLTPREAFAEIVGHTFRFDPSSTPALRDELVTLVRLAGAEWFRRLTVPRSYPALGAVHDTIARDLHRVAAA